MAEVRQRFGRAAYDLVLKISNRHRLESQKKHSKTFMSSSSLSPGFLPDNNRNGELCGAQSAAGRVTAGVSQDTSYTTGFGHVDHVCEKENNAEHSFHLGLKRCSLSDKTWVQNIEGNCPQYKSNAVFKRTCCTSRTAPSKRRGEFVFVRAYSGTRSEPLHKTKTGYYEILEVTSNATQAQIKTAYYKQSFIYHPDRNAGSDDATVRFSEISEAYTVLGNKALKKKYDRGLLSQSDLTASVRPSSGRDASGSTAGQQTGSRRHSVLDGDDRGGVFDFDKFFKEHYGEQLQRQKDVSARKEELLKRKHESIADKKLIGVTEMGLMVMLLMAVALIISLKRGH
ncbi:uncharacterized protein LOC132993179 [Labrus mixtus]|uniref:uncharacterized protein LOC132993179 n=1 Tax=Labrus mixtus TaxID=508554 RepID=UPI0029C02F8B|nr:uncharacterized protein LOC132993179 [Labrus mixtus]